jgi:predicted RNA-binding Zn-ribbon protein involved in translation (DUF1610 family)
MMDINGNCKTCGQRIASTHGCPQCDWQRVTCLGCGQSLSVYELNTLHVCPKLNLIYPELEKKA